MHRDGIIDRSVGRLEAVIVSRRYALRYGYGPDSKGDVLTVTWLDLGFPCALFVYVLRVHKRITVPELAFGGLFLLVFIHA